MDKVRFGRALGYGARHVAKTLRAAAEAAAAPGNGAATPQRHPDESAATNSRTEPQPARFAPIAAHVKQVAREVREVRNAQQNLGKHARRSFLGPLAKFSSVVSLQVTGTFFALIAIIMTQAAWRSRAAVHLGAGSPEARRFYLVSGVALLFVYFAISNFVRARRRDNR